MGSAPTSLRERIKRRLPDVGQMRDRMRTRARALRRRLQSGEDEPLAERLSVIDEDFVERGAEDISEVDLDTVIERAEAIEERFRQNKPLQRLLEDGRLLLAFVRDARSGRYPKMPVWTLSAVGFALLYVLNPFDVVPDALPLLGLIDDAAVVSACFSLVEQDLRDYKNWKRALQEKNGEKDEVDAAEDLISS